MVPPHMIAEQVTASSQAILRGQISFFILLTVTLFFTGCAKRQIGPSDGVNTMVIETTGYCGCSQCCGWERGNWLFLKLDFWNRYVNYGKYAGRPYTGRTASGTTPTEPQPGFFSLDSLERPWMIPTRLILFPWYFLPEKGTIAADTQYYPFGTRMYIPGYGWGVVEDKGGAIKGPDRIDLFFDSHADAINWGRRKATVEIERR
ncbi:MAG: 3D domain-containing protein [Desulfocapsaceae bacterium]|nr:3D domain-containing protein [Desulfocapsaceae bacterium]